MRIERRASFGWPLTAAGTAPCTNGLVIHYDGAPKPRGVATMDHDRCRQYWRDTRTFHMGPQRGWLDIGYSFGVCGHGIVLEGRGFGRQQAAQPGGNTTWTSVTLMLGDGEDPTPAQIEGVRELRAWLRGKGMAAAVKGHRAFVSTSCPGSRLWALVQVGTFAKPPQPSTSSPTAPPWPGRVLVNRSPLMHGSDVLAWQRQMRERKWGLVADGYYGPKSEQACKSFQRDHELLIDGEVGPATWEATWKGR